MYSESAVKYFTIAGPVILYGILSSWFLGLIYYLFENNGGTFHDKTIHLWSFQHFPFKNLCFIQSCASVTGQKEGDGPLGSCF